MKILIAEDEIAISDTYKRALESVGHKVILTENGQDCLSVYKQYLDDYCNTAVAKEVGLTSNTPFDAVVLDYKMPQMDGMDAAKAILAYNHNQRIIFASAYVYQTLVESVKELSKVVELLQKPFELQALIDTIEDKTIYEGLKQMNANIQSIKATIPTHDRVAELFYSLKKLQKGRTF